jgi:hypothetical protein
LHDIDAEIVGDFVSLYLRGLLAQIIGRQPGFEVRPSKRAGDARELAGTLTLRRVHYLLHQRAQSQRLACRPSERYSGRSQLGH